MTRPQSPPVLRGTYTALALRRGNRANCLYRDCLMVVTGWSDGPISWPVGRPLNPRGGPGRLIVDEELARAVRHESAAAVAYWWGVSSVTVSKWRRALDVNRKNNEGSQILIRAALKKATAAKPLVPSEEYRQKQRENTIRRRLWELAPKVTRGKPWTPEQQSLVGTMSDQEAASRTGHPLRSVGHMRRKLQIAPYAKWTPEQQSLLGTMPDKEAAARTGHPLRSVGHMRRKLQIAPYAQWTPEQQSLLGTMTDKEAAARTGHPLRSVRHMRLNLGIPPYCSGGQTTGPHTAPRSKSMLRGSRERSPVKK